MGPRTKRISTSSSADPSSPTDLLEPDPLDAQDEEEEEGVAEGDVEGNEEEDNGDGNQGYECNLS
jgi:hypothetical protein